jgi:hypothetical protein
LSPITIMLEFRSPLGFSHFHPINLRNLHDHHPNSYIYQHKAMPPSLCSQLIA